jgi:ribosomal protein S18 acetylase RimI-like enzyme
MQPSDLNQVVAVHVRAFSGFFLTFLGPTFLRLMYRQLRNNKDGVVFVATRGARLVGFAAGVTRQVAFYRHLIVAHSPQFALAATGMFLRHPSVLKRLLRAFRQPEYVRQSAAEACLMSLAVVPELHGSGIGKCLVDEFCDELFRRGASSVSLTTDGDNNDRVNAFYRKVGFRVARSFVTPEGRRINEYLKQLV